MDEPEHLLDVRSVKGFKSLYSKFSFKQGEIICSLPCTSVSNKPTQHTVQAGRYKHIEVGVIASLAVTFGHAVLFPAGVAAPAWTAVGITVVALLVLLRTRLDLLWVIAGGALAGWLAGMA
jgi:hypothetical protein